VLGLPRLLAVLKVFSVPAPTTPPEGWRLWPLWYVSHAFVHTRRAGALLIVGLLLNALLPIHLPWVA